MRQYRREPADLVVCDIFMDAQDGLETIRALRKEFPDARVLAVSDGGHVVPGDYLPVAEALGATASPPKPLTGTELIKAVGRLLCP